MMVPQLLAKMHKQVQSLYTWKTELYFKKLIWVHLLLCSALLKKKYVKLLIQ